MRRRRRSSSRSASSSIGCPSPSSWRRRGARCSRRPSCTPGWAAGSTCSPRGPSDQPERLRSMHATISWSYDALPPDVQSAVPPVVGVLGRLEPGRGGGGVRADGHLRRRWVGDPARPPSRPTRRHRRRNPVRDVRDRPGVRPSTSWRTTTTQPTWRDGTRRTSWRSPAPPSASSPRPIRRHGWIGSRPSTTTFARRCIGPWSPSRTSPSTWPGRCGDSGCCAAT